MVHGERLRWARYALPAGSARTADGIIFHLWPDGAKVPNGEVMFPTVINHKPVTKLEIEKDAR